MSLNPDFIITLKNKKFVLFAGLLDLAHQKGLTGIETEVCLGLSNPAEQFWVVKATGRFSNDNGGQVFSAYGDASPASSQMRGAYLRHAETRAAARMLRLATNVGMASIEELGDLSEERDEPQERPQAPRQVNQPPESSGDAGAARDDGQQAFCAVCGLELSKGQAMVSMRRYSRCLCPAHQREQPVTTDIG